MPPPPLPSRQCRDANVTASFPIDNKNDLDDPRWPFKNRNMLPDAGEEAQSMAQMIEEFMPRHDLPDTIIRELHRSRDDEFCPPPPHSSVGWVRVPKPLEKAA